MSTRAPADIYPAPDVWVMNADGTALTRLTDNLRTSGVEVVPRWEQNRIHK
jgi:Tol biopolymer transport system component